MGDSVRLSVPFSPFFLSFFVLAVALSGLLLPVASGFCFLFA